MQETISPVFHSLCYKFWTIKLYQGFALSLQQQYHKKPLGNITTSNDIFLILTENISEYFTETFSRNTAQIVKISRLIKICFQLSLQPSKKRPSLNDFSENIHINVFLYYPQIRNS